MTESELINLISIIKPKRIEEMAYITWNLFHIQYGITQIQYIVYAKIS